MSSARKIVVLCVLLSAPVFAACPSSAVQAGPQVAPVGLTSLEGSSNNVFLFGRDKPVRIMDVYDRAELPASFQFPRLITQVTLRADERNNAVLYPQKRNILLDLSISTSHATAELTSLVYDEFHGRDRVDVFSGRLDVPLQSVPSVPSSPRPHNVAIPFAQTWYFNLSPSRGGAKAPSTLVLDYQVAEKITGSDYVLDQTGFCSSVSSPFGLGATCLGSGGKPVTIQADGRAYANNDLIYTVQGVIPTNAIRLIVKVGPLGTPVPVPIDLAAGCYINFIPMLTFTGTANARGEGIFTYPIPRSQNLVGLDVHAQAAGYDINANSGAHVSSLGLTTTVCGPRGVCQLMQLNSGSTSPSAQSNVYGMAHVVEFR
jgi:hypothetical protein